MLTTCLNCDDELNGCVVFNGNLYIYLTELKTRKEEVLFTLHLIKFSHKIIRRVH